MTGVQTCALPIFKFQHLSSQTTLQHGITEVGDTVPTNVVSGEQIHKDKIAWVTEVETTRNQRIAQADALLSKESGVTLAVRTADCVPLLLATPRSNIIGTIHAGWRGLALDIVRKTIETIPFPIRRQTLVGIGPAICAQCFEVGPEVARQFSKEHVQESPHTNRKFLVDLHQTAYSQLLEAGIPEKNIELLEICSFESNQLYSYRRKRQTPMLHTISWIMRQN